MVSGTYSTYTAVWVDYFTKLYFKVDGLNSLA